MRIFATMLAAGLLALGGCGEQVENVAPPASAAPAAAAPAAPKKVEPINLPIPPGAPANAAGQPVAGKTPLPDVPAVLASDPDEKGPDAEKPAAGDREEATAGVGKKGRGYGGGIYTEPIHVKFLIEQRLVFEAQIPKAMQLYKAEHDNKGPPTHEAFMKDIIEDGLIKLPELPDNYKYVYDPKTEKLMVEHPPE